MSRDHGRGKTRWDWPFHSRIFIGNFDHRSISREQVEKMFSKYGEIKERIQIHQGYCFVQYGDESTATRALNSENGRILGTKKIEIQYAKVTNRDRDRRGSSGGYKRSRQDSNSRYDPPSKKYKREVHSKRPEPHRSHSSVSRVPLFVFGYNLVNYANIVKQQFLTYGVTADAFYVGNDFVKTTPNEKYLLYIFPRNAVSSTISFCAVNDDGSTHGFIDTPMMDVLKYVHTGLGGVGTVPAQQTVQPSYNVNYSYGSQTSVPQVSGYGQAPHQTVKPTIPQYTPNYSSTNTHLTAQSQQQVYSSQVAPKAASTSQSTGLKSLLNRLSNINKK